VPAAPPIKYGLGYRSRTRTLTLNPNLNPNPKVTKMYAVQKDTGIKFNIELYIKVIFVRRGWVYKRSITGSGSMGHTYMTSHTLDSPVRL